MSLIETALSQYGQKEIEGKEDNPTIISYARDSGFMWVSNDETAWCAIFMNWVAMKDGYERTHLPNARSWLKIGEKIETPHVGDVVIFKRGNSTWQGHVALFVRVDGEYIYCLGGNQSNQVKISKYKKSDLLGYRRLKKLV